MEAKLLEYRKKKENEQKSDSFFLLRLFSADKKSPEQTQGAVKRFTVVEKPSGFREEESNTHKLNEASGQEIVHSRNEYQEIESVASYSGKFNKWRSHVLLFLYVVLWLLLWKFFVEIQFGAVYFILSVSYICYRNTRTGPSDPTRLSAYSVFNANQERLDGTFTTEQFEKEIRFGAASVNFCKEDKSKSAKPRDVIIVGGGLAGTAAARELLQNGIYSVKVFEARKSRYGGRIWTKRSIGQRIKGAEAEMGAVFLNTRVKNNPLIKLAEKFGLPTKTAGSLQVHFPEENLVYSGENATYLYSEAFKILISAISKAKNQDQDVSIKDAVESEWKLLHTNRTDQDVMYEILKTVPFPGTQNFSAHLYDFEADFGWDSIVLDGLDSLLDRIVAGDGMDRPVKVELNKVVRNIKVDDKRHKVLVRTMDRKQAEADAVIVAVPAGVLKQKELIFEPPLSKDWYQSIQDLGIYTTDRLIVQFDKVFWPEDVGSFAVFSADAAGGFLQMWTNLYRLTGAPYLAGNVFGETAVAFEKMSDKELKQKVTVILSQMFGTEKLKKNKIKFITYSKWTQNKFSLGSSAYPKVGNTADMWKTLQQPVCPYIYFAGAYTESNNHIESLHGAYNSGVRAANQIISNVCQDKKKTNTKKKTAKKSKDEL